MARRKGRIKDKWREKRWVNVNAPDSFNNVPIAYVPITDDENASTIFKRFEYSKEFLRSLVRRGSSKINFIIDIKTKDGYVFRVKVIALTHRPLNTSRKHALRIIARDVINKTVPEMTIDQFVQATVYSKINSDLMAAFKRVIKVRHVCLEKVKLIRTADKETKLLEA